MSRTRCALVALLALAAPLDARFPVHETVSGVFAEQGPARHPSSEQQVLRVTGVMRGDVTALVLHYWRTVDRDADRGRISARIKVVRDFGGGGKPATLYSQRVTGRVRERQWARVLTNLPDLRSGDLILITYRLRQMPRLLRYDAAYAETLLRNDAVE